MANSIKEVLEQAVQINDIGYAPESIPKDGSKNWFTANGRVFRFHTGQALKEIEAIIRTEKLKLLAEVRERQIPVIALKAKKPHDEVQIQAVPIESLTKLEAEL